MNFQEKLFEATADLRARASAFASTALIAAQARAERRFEALKGSIETLSVARRSFNKVARTHAARFVKQNSAIALDAGREVSALARSTYTTLAKRDAAAPKARTARTAGTARKARVTRKRASAKAA